MSILVFEVVGSWNPDTLDAQVLEKRWSGQSGSEREFELLISVVSGENVEIGRTFVTAVIYAEAEKGDKLTVRKAQKPPLIVTADGDVERQGAPFS